MVCGATSMTDRPARSGAAKVFCSPAWLSAASGTDTSKVEPTPGVAFQRNAAAHPLDDAFADAKPEAGAAIIAGGAFVRLFEFAKNSLLGVGRDADAGVAYQEADFARVNAGLDDQCATPPRSR